MRPSWELSRIAMHCKRLGIKTTTRQWGDSWPNYWILWHRLCTILHLRATQCFRRRPYTHIKCVYAGPRAVRIRHYGPRAVCICIVWISCENLPIDIVSLHHQWLKYGIPKGRGPKQKTWQLVTFRIYREVWVMYVRKCGQWQKWSCYCRWYPARARVQDPMVEQKTRARKWPQFARRHLAYSTRTVIPDTM